MLKISIFKKEFSSVQQDYLNKNKKQKQNPKMRIISNTASHCRVRRQYIPANKPLIPRSVLNVFFNLVIAVVLILVSAKLLSMLETSITNSIEPASAATYENTIEQPYYYNDSTLEAGFINRDDLYKAPTPVKTEENNQPKDEADGKVISWLRNLLIPTAQAAELDISAQLMSVSPSSEITINPGKAITIEVKFKNTGNYTWSNNNYNFVALATVDPTMRHSDFQHKFWEEYYRTARIVEKSVKPGEIATIRFAIQAPDKKGEYMEKFQLVARRLDWISGGELNLYINVGNVAKEIVYNPVVYVKEPVPEETHIASTQYDDQNNPTSNISEEEVANISESYTNFGPQMRVGLYTTKQPITLTANGDYYIKDQSGDVLTTKQSGQSTSAVFDWMNKRYIVSSDDFNTSGKSYIRFELVDPENSFFTVTSYDARPDFNPNVNYNDFRYILELRYAPATKNLWLINELPMEKYLLGISETHKYAPIEFLKAMTIAARTYGMYHQERQTKHADEFFTVDSKYDQVYRGAAIEDILIDWKKAVAATSGMVVTYNDKIAITPYFASSDGRTRSFAEVWYNEVPWLQSVSCDYEEDGELFGHGVGLSAVDAMRRAKAGADYKEILKHYYTGVDITKIY